jgi:hypothetical protein
MLTNTQTQQAINESVLANTKSPDASYGGHIDISDVWEAFYWCNALGCTFEELRAAVKARGTSAGAVRAYFRN